ncbi:MAG: hypothetical protein NVS9B3_05750 [Gemmatimonadaceae bacterium]
MADPLPTARSGDGFRRAHLPPALAVGFGVFVAGIAYLLASSLARRDMPTFAPSLVGRAISPAGQRWVDTLTVDAREETAWRFVTFSPDGGAHVLATGDTTGWDLAVRRHRIMAADAIADVGTTPFDSLIRAPAAGYRSNNVDSINGAVLRWYDYNMVTHLLRPARRVYVLRGHGGRYAKLEMLSYYCPGLRAGCLTFRSSPLPAPSRP